jgi:hypothetical protein
LAQRLRPGREPSGRRPPAPRKPVSFISRIRELQRLELGAELGAIRSRRLSARQFDAIYGRPPANAPALRGYLAL